MVYDINGNVICDSFYASVVEFGAKGDGITDDAAAIQAAIDSVKVTGGTIFFPAGTYLVNSIIRFYSNQHLIFDAGTTMKGGSSSIDALLVGYVDSNIGGYDGLENVIIEGGYFIRGSLYSSSTLIAFSHAKNVIVRNARFKGAPGWHDLEFNSTKNGLVENCCFDGSAKSNSNGCQIQLDCKTATNYPWADTGLDDSTGCDGIEIKNCFFENNSASPFIGSHSNSGSNVRIHDNIFDSNTSTRGAIQFYTLANLDVFENTFTGCTTGLSFSGTGAASCYAHDNRFTGATTAISSAITEQHNNWINGTFVA